MDKYTTLRAWTVHHTIFMLVWTLAKVKSKPGR